MKLYWLLASSLIFLDGLGSVSAAERGLGGLFSRFLGSVSGRNRGRQASSVSDSSIGMIRGLGQSDSPISSMTEDDTIASIDGDASPDPPKNPSIIIEVDTNAKVDFDDTSSIGTIRGLSQSNFHPTMKEDESMDATDGDAAPDSPKNPSTIEVDANAKVDFDDTSSIGTIRGLHQSEDDSAIATAPIDDDATPDPKSPSAVEVDANAKVNFDADDGPAASTIAGKHLGSSPSLTTDATVSGVHGLSTSRADEGASARMRVRKNAPAGTMRRMLEDQDETWRDLSYDDFEDGWGDFKPKNGKAELIHKSNDGDGDMDNYILGGSTSALISNQAPDSNQGTFAHKHGYDVSFCSKLQVQFSFMARNMEDGDAFALEYKAGGSPDWQEMKKFTKGEDFTENDVTYTETVDFDKTGNDYKLETDAMIRFKCKGKGKKKKIYFDPDEDEVSIDQVAFQGLCSDFVAGKWSTIASESFEDGKIAKSVFKRIAHKDFDGRTQIFCGGSDSGAAHGDCALRLKHWRGASVQLKEHRDVTAFTALRVQLWFMCQSFNKGDGFRVEYGTVKNDDSTTWKILSKYIHDKGEDFNGEEVENDVIYHKTLYLHNFDMTKEADIKLNHEASGDKDRTYIYDVQFQGTYDAYLSPVDLWGSDTQWDTITFDDFEGYNGWGNFKRTSSSEDQFAKYVDRGLHDNDEYIPSGDGCLRIHGNKGRESSVFHKIGHDVSGFSNLRLYFMVEFENFDFGHYFDVDFSSNGGESWTIVKRCLYSETYSQVGIDFGEEIGKDLYLNTKEAKIRFRCAGCGYHGSVYIDVVLLEGLPSPWNMVSFDDFEDGWGNFTRTSGSSHKYAKHIVSTDNHADFIPLGEGALRISNNEGTKSSVVQEYRYDVSEFIKLRVSFMFMFRSLEEDNGFVLEYSPGAGEWTVMKRFKHDKYNNGIAQQVVVDFDRSGKDYDLTDEAKIRFRCSECGANDDVFIDEVLLEGVKWQDISFDDFEYGWGGFTRTSGSSHKYAKHIDSTDNHAEFIPLGEGALRISDNEGTKSSVFQDECYDVSGYTKLQVSFKFMFRSLEEGNGFVLEYSPGCDVDWNVIKRFKHDNYENDKDHEVVVDFDRNVMKHVWDELPSKAKIRFRCSDCGANDEVFIDEVAFKGLPF